MCLSLSNIFCGLVWFGFSSSDSLLSDGMFGVDLFLSQSLLCCLVLSISFVVSSVYAETPYFIGLIPQMRCSFSLTEGIHML